MMYLVITPNQVCRFKRPHEVAGAFYQTHHRKEGIKKVDDEWWINYPDEKTCRTALSCARKERDDITKAEVRIQFVDESGESSGYKILQHDGSPISARKARSSCHSARTTVTPPRPPELSPTPPHKNKVTEPLEGATKKRTRIIEGGDALHSKIKRHRVSKTSMGVPQRRSQRLLSRTGACHSTLRVNCNEGTQASSPLEDVHGVFAEHRI